MEIKAELLAIIDEVLGLKGRAAAFNDDTPLLGAIPELDSMAVIALITSLEDRLDCRILDDEIDGSAFATVGTLVSFVKGKVGA